MPNRVSTSAVYSSGCSRMPPLIRVVVRGTKVRAATARTFSTSRLRRIDRIEGDMDAGVRPRGHGIGGVPAADEPGVDDGLRLRVDKGVEGHDLVCQLQNGGGPVFVAAPGMGGNPRNPHVEMPRAPALGGHAAVREPRFRADDGAPPR